MYNLEKNIKRRDKIAHKKNPLGETEGDLNKTQ